MTVDGWPSAPSQTFVSRRMRTLEASLERTDMGRSDATETGAAGNQRLRAGASCVLRQVVFAFPETDLVLSDCCGDEG